MVVLVDIRPLEGATRTLQFLSSFPKRTENALVTHQCHCCGLRGPCPACQVLSCPPSRSWHRHPYIKDTSLLIIILSAFLHNNLRGMLRRGGSTVSCEGANGSRQAVQPRGPWCKPAFIHSESPPAHIFKDGYFNNRCSARHLQPQILLLAHRVRRRACSRPMAK